MVVLGLDSFFAQGQGNMRPENKTIPFRQLLIAKNLFLHGLEHSNNDSDLDKIIAVHNFHNAIELALKAIVLNYEIRTGQSIINFEALLKLIDDHEDFKKRKQRLPYRRELSSLNQTRNMVQHDGLAPETSKMEMWRVITKNFLVNIFDEYFGCNFDEISSITLIDDSHLRQLIELAFSKLSEGAWFDAAAISELAFTWGSANIYESIPDQKMNSPYYVIKGSNSRTTIDLTEIENRIKSVEQLVAILSNGISLKDYNKFKVITPKYTFLSDGSYRSNRTKDVTGEQAKWIHDFVVNSIINWQLSGLKPSLAERVIPFYEAFVESVKTKTPGD